MNNIQQVLAFASTARHRSFAKAARELSLSPSAVAKSVSRLEARFGLKLFYRTTRQVSLTADGQALFAQCQRVLEEVEMLRTVAAGARGAPSGTLTISAPLTYGKYVVLPKVMQLLNRHAELSIDVRLSDSVEDLVREGLDAAIRIGSLEDSRFVARAFDQQILGVCGSPDYVARRGSPKTPQDLERHDCLLFRMPTSGRPRVWEFLVNGELLRLTPSSRVRLSDGEALVSAAIEGHGLVQAPLYMTRDAIRDGRLVECLTEYRPASLPISVVHASGHTIAPRIRALIDALVGAGDSKGAIRPSRSSSRKAAASPSPRRR